MIVKTGKVSKLAAWLLGTVNFLVMVFCLLLFAMSLWIICSPATLSNMVHQSDVPTLKALLPPPILTVQNGAGSATLALVVFSIALMGFCGAVSRSKFTLFMYTTILLLLLLLECALTFYFSSNLIEKGLQDGDGQWTHALRLLFQCCDFKNSTVQATLKPPWSCCGSDYYPENCTIDNANLIDCKSVISNWIDRHITVVYTALAAIHVVLVSCSLLRRSRCTSRSHS